MAIYFGTDGIRGVATEDLTNEICFRCGNALPTLKKGCKILLGRDTRTSGSFVTASFVSGATLGGASVVDIGIVPTPCISVLVKKLKADFGVMISASHNPPEYNGIKIFDSTGKKIDEKTEVEIERCFAKQKAEKPSKLGKYVYSPKYIKIYAEFLTKCVDFNFNGLNVVLDCSNGASYLLAAKCFKKLGATVTKIHSQNRGDLINVNCGALNPGSLSKTVVKQNADIGFAFDGDADRIVAVDEKGNIIDGDKIVVFLTNAYKRFGLLKSSAVVGTTQTNFSVEAELEKIGVKLLRTDVGDKYVTTLMLAKNLQIGGEQSGHIILTDYECTGDGVLCALIISKFLSMSKQKFSELTDQQMTTQYTKNIVVPDKYITVSSTVLNATIKDCELLLNGEGRIVVRASGTEPKVRLMVESQNEKLAKIILEKLENAVLLK